MYLLVKIFIGKLNELSDPTIIFKNVMFLEKIYKSLLVLIKFKMIKRSGAISQRDYINIIRRYLNRLIIGERERKEDIIDAIIYDIISDKNFNDAIA